MGQKTVQVNAAVMGDMENLSSGTGIKRMRIDLNSS